MLHPPGLPPSHRRIAPRKQRTGRLVARGEPPALRIAARVRFRNGNQRHTSLREGRAGQASDVLRKHLDRRPEDAAARALLAVARDRAE